MKRCPRCDTLDASNGQAPCPRCLNELPLPVHVVAGYLELGEVIGQGGMGTVFAAKDLRLGRDVAVKLITPEPGARDDSRARIRREAHALALLNHPNIVTLLDFAEDEGEHYLVMERVRGDSLATQLPLPKDKALPLAIQVCDAVGYAHGRGIVHRDLKPANVLVDERGQAKVTDFGIARWVRQPGWTVTRADSVAGTPQYMAPEVLSGAPPDPRADVYSLGVLIHQMVTGRLPSVGQSPLPLPLQRVLHKALAPEPELRFNDASELASAIRELGDLAEGLSADERSWTRAVSLVLTLSSAIALWSLLVSLTPKLISDGAVQPLLTLATRPGPPGQRISWARFELGPMLAAIVAAALGLGAYGLLRRHWRMHELESPGATPRPGAARALFYLGAAQCAAFLLHRWVFGGEGLLLALMPVVGGVLGLVSLWLFWLGLLERVRCHAGLGQARLWLGLALAAVPSCAEFAIYLSRWSP